MRRINARKKTFETLSAARAYALAQSIKFPAEYVAIIREDVSGIPMGAVSWMVIRRTRLNTFAPSDYTHWSGNTGTYWIDGTENLL